jgi:hypothetical protein
MEFIFYTAKPFESMKPYTFNYDGYRSRFVKGMDPNNPPTNILSSSQTFSSTPVDEEKIKELIRNTFPIIAFEIKNDLPYSRSENNIIEVKSASRFEDLALVQKKKYLVSIDPLLFLNAVCSIFLNLEKKGTAIITFSSSSFSLCEKEKQGKNESGEIYDLINLLASNFEQTKISKNILILEKFTEKYKKQAIKYLHYRFDAKRSIKLFLEPNNKKLEKFLN